MRKFEIILIGVIVSSIFVSCNRHLDYHRLTGEKGVKIRDTVVVAYSNLPIKVAGVFDTYKFEYFRSKKQSEKERKSMKPLSWVYSLDSSVKVVFTKFSCADTWEDRWKPYGFYFHLNETKFFMHYGEDRAPIVYSDGDLYYPLISYFDPNENNADKPDPQTKFVKQRIELD